MLGYVSFILGLFVSDEFLKDRAERTLSEDRILPICGDRFHLQLHRNRGAMLNAGSNKPRAVAALSLALCLFATFIFLLSLGQAGKGLFRFGLSMLLGGAYSNTFDRIRRGYVVDYLRLHVKWKWLYNIIFNISDFAILFGILLAWLGSDFKGSTD